MLTKVMIASASRFQNYHSLCFPFALHECDVSFLFLQLDQPGVLENGDAVLHVI